MSRSFAVAAIAVAVCLAGGTGSASASPFTPGAPGIGDPYFPLDGNGGYDATHYLLAISYDPPTDTLKGVATIDARATQNLSSFNLDLHGLNVESITVDGRPVGWSRDADELTVTPPRGIASQRAFRTVIAYDGVPETIDDGSLGLSGFIHTDDGALIAGQPKVAATWYPVNDHPLDKASYEFRVKVPAGLKAIANGVLKSSTTRNGITTWDWDAKEPMASYLATSTIGVFDLKTGRAGNIKTWDALDPDLFVGVAPRTGSQYAISQASNFSYKRLAHTIDLTGQTSGQLSFSVTRDTETNWDFMFVEAHTVGANDWTTLPDANGHTSDDTGFVCPFSIELHPFLAHYETDNGDDTCSPIGTTGKWNAVSGPSDGYEQWSVDLSAYAGKKVEVSISYASDNTINHAGLFVDDVNVSTGEGTTSFEADGDTLDGWTVPGAPAGSDPNPNDWIAGPQADQPETTGDLARDALAEQPQILRFLSQEFGPYPFSAAGGIVDDVDGLEFALENQTRPIYSKVFFDDRAGPNDSVVVHELTHQWFGDSVALAAWQHIWLNEGFATYAEWLWSEHQGDLAVQDFYDSYAGMPADDPFWSLEIGDPGPDDLFDDPVYIRGAMTLHALRLRIGDGTFFTLLRKWAASHAGGHGTTPEFIALAEQLSGQDLGAFFDEWLFTASKPASLGSKSKMSRSSAVGRLLAHRVPHLKR
jgi:Peptidase family M1 domain/Peptidase M1 N-terminal domain/Immune inhibitor A peptidase M6